LRIDPRNGEAQYTLGKALLEQGQQNAAIKPLTESAGLLPEDPRPYYLLARAYAKMDKQEESARALQQFAELKKKQGATSGMAYRPN
jgi:predicted Zn-dependent protease